jgi:hypothetical protein
MPNLAHRSLSNRRLVTALAIGALLAALVFIQGAAVRGVAASAKAASPKPQAVLANCTAASIATSAPQPLPPIATVTLSASSTSCVSPQYRFLVLAPGSSTWVFKTGYTSSATYNWNAAGAALGVWQIGVWARESGSTARYNAYAISSLNFGYDNCTGALIVPIPGGPQPAGQSVSITGYVQGCTMAPAKIEFWKLAPGSSTWVLVQGYSALPIGVTLLSWSWDTTGAAKGAWRWAVWVRSFYSPRRYDSYATLTYWIT